MELQGKKINFLGDSITEGAGTSGKGHVFCDLIGEAYGAVTRNYGISGTRYAKQHTPSGDARWDLDFCSRVEGMDPDADMVVVFGGTNDFGHGDAPLGTPADRTPDTFYGACHTLYTSLVRKYPTAVIAVLTPLHRCNEDNPRGDGFKAYTVAPLSTYVAIIREVAAVYGLPVLDLFAAGGIQPKIEEQKTRLMPDGLHPNDEGQKVLARKVANFLFSL